MQEFKRTTNGFNFVFEKELESNETVILKMPPVSSNKRGFNDIGWQSDGDVKLYGTLSRNPEGSKALWQEINPLDEVNRTVSALKIINEGASCSVVVRVLLN